MTFMKVKVQCLTVSNSMFSGDRRPILPPQDLDSLPRHETRQRPHL